MRPRLLPTAFAALAAGLTAAPAHAQVTVTIGANFTGNTLTDVQNLTGRTIAPPDTDGSVGLGHYVQFTNGTFAIYNKSDGSLATPKVSDTTFWLNAGISATITNQGLSDTRIVFDPASQRWFASEINLSNTGNRVLIARSNTADPTQGFKATSYVANSGFADYPTLGVNADGVFVGTNNFSSGGSNTLTGVSITSIPKADLLAATPSVANRTTQQGTPSGLGFTLQAANDFGPSPGHATVLGTNLSSIGQLLVTPVGNVAGSGSATFGPTATVSVLSAPNPGLAHQPDGTRQISGNDNRIGGAVYKVGDLIYAVQGTTSSSHDAIRWTVMRDSTQTVVKQGTIGDANYDFIYPSIAANAQGTVVIGFTRGGLSTTDGQLSAYAVVGTTDSQGNVNFGTPFVLKQGLTDGYHLFGGSNERWGDFSATGVDPNDPNIFWTTQEFAGPGSNLWETQVTEIIVSPVPEPALALLAAVAAGALVARSRRAG